MILDAVRECRSWLRQLFADRACNQPRCATSAFDDFVLEIVRRANHEPVFKALRDVGCRTDFPIVIAGDAAFSA